MPEKTEKLKHKRQCKYDSMMLGNKLSIVNNYLKWCLLILLFACTLSLAANSLMAAVPRFGIDEQNSRCLLEPLVKTGFPFKAAWTCDLGGTVESQPILSQGSIYVQAGQRLCKISLTGKLEAQSPILSKSTLPSGSSPSFAWTTFGPRIYQATRDHRLWALDPETLQPLWQQGNQDLPYIELSAAGQPQLRYRVTSSPLVLNINGKTRIVLGTANGDGSGLPGQFADNGFLILEDQGAQCVVELSQVMPGEVTGSPIRFRDQILATQNQISHGENPLIIYDATTLCQSLEVPQLGNGIPGSPAAEGNFVYLADRSSRLVCLQQSADNRWQVIWSNPRTQDPDWDRTTNSYNLRSPAIGRSAIYLPIQDYRGTNRGAVIAVDKQSGQTKQIRWFDQPLGSNLIYWQPADSPDNEYVLVFQADGKAVLLDGTTLKPVYGFIDKEGTPQQQVQLLPKEGLGACPEPIIAENLLLLVDGKGILHAFEGQGPINFTCSGLELTDQTAQSLNQIEQLPGQQNVVLKLTNQSRVSYLSIPLIIKTKTKIIFAESLDLAAGETKVLTCELPIEAIGQELVAEINPSGHQGEIVEEIYPRLDNRYRFQLIDSMQDLEVISLVGPSQGTLGKRETLTASVHNHSSIDLKQVKVGWYQDGQLIKQEFVDFAAGVTKQIKWLWQSPKVADLVQLKVWVDPEATLIEKDRVNNQKEIYLSFIPKAVVIDCTNQLESKSWMAVYSRIIGYQQRQRPDCWVSYYGTLICQTVTYTDYSSPIWQSVQVPYSESLSAQVVINSGQGVRTDPQHPKSTDRDSRGSWAIIPYAREHNLNPNEVTRAGYGFEVEVTTSYYTDWETKVPQGLAGTAQPIGGSLQGPETVSAEFYDSRGYLVGEVPLEQVSGTRGSGQAIWRLPKATHRYTDGTVTQQRKHFTAPDIPDGDYLVLVKVANAGRHHLSTCVLKKVRIFGSMYDDQYTSIAK